MSASPDKWLAAAPEPADLAAQSSRKHQIACYGERAALRRHPMVEAALEEWWSLVLDVMATSAKEAAPVGEAADEPEAETVDEAEAAEQLAMVEPKPPADSSPFTSLAAATAAAVRARHGVPFAAFSRLYACVCKALLPSFERADAKARARADWKLHGGGGTGAAARLEKAAFGDALFGAADAFTEDTPGARRAVEYAAFLQMLLLTVTKPVEPAAQPAAQPQPPTPQACTQQPPAPAPSPAPAPPTALTLKPLGEVWPLRHFGAEAARIAAVHAERLSRGDSRAEPYARLRILSAEAQAIAELHALQAALVAHEAALEPIVPFLALPPTLPYPSAPFLALPRAGRAQGGRGGAGQGGGGSRGRGRGGSGGGGRSRARRPAAHVRDGPGLFRRWSSEGRSNLPRPSTSLPLAFHEPS